MALQKKFRKFRKKIARKRNRVKLNRFATSLKTILLLLTPFIIAGGTALGAYWVMSNTIIVTWHDYTITLEANMLDPDIGENVTLTATLQRTDVMPIIGATIYLDRNDVEISSNTTDVNGQCTFTVTRETQGSYSFNTRHYVP